MRLSHAYLRHRLPLILCAVFALLILIFFWRYVLTDRILARGDTYAYFYPYWHARDAALRAGTLPLWTPDLFMGVPLLANSQLGTFYPPNWLVMSFSAPDAVRISILLHIAWALIGAYRLARDAAGLGRVAAVFAGAVFAFGGHVGAHIEQINQLQGLAWMPWLFWLLHRALARPLPQHRGVAAFCAWTLRGLPLLMMAFAMQFLSGHTQTVFITGIGLGVYGLIVGRWRCLPLLALAGIGALLLSIPQLIPTLELMAQSNREGGFNPNQATAFSFSPFVAGRGLLPAYDHAIFGEYIAYVGVIGLGLAVIGALTAPHAAPRGWRSAFKSPRVVWAVVALIGLFLAFGLYNPVYWWLAGLPGFNLFRVPARWLALTALGLALLAGMGLQMLMTAPDRIHRRVWVAIVALIVALGLGSMLATRTPEFVPMSTPTLASVIAWGVALAVLIVGMRFSRGRGYLPLMVMIAGLVELFLAANVLPYNDLVGREAFHDQRFTISQMLALQEDESRAGRFLSISNLYFDPGDRAALEARYADMRLTELGRHTAFTALKMKETLAANLPLIWQIPTIDGFDGGILPTAHYTAFASLLLPPEELRTIDGRLREMLAKESCRGACIPPMQWLNLTNTRYLITDKIYDVWRDGVSYDTQFAVEIAPDAPYALRSVPDFVADAVEVLYTCAASDCPSPSVTLTDADGTRETLTDSGGDSVDAFAWVRVAVDDASYAPRALEIAAPVEMTIHAVTLVDTRTGDFAHTTLGDWRRVLSSDIKLYENLEVLPRAFVVHQALTAADDIWGTESALALMRDPAFDPTKTAVLHVPRPVPDMPLMMADVEGASAVIVRDDAEFIEIAVNAPDAGYLILTDAYYPGWHATLDGDPVEIVRANVMFRAVRVPAGESIVTFAYRPAWMPSVFIVAAVLWGGLFALMSWRWLKPKI